MSYWFALGAAIIFEVAGTMSLKYSTLQNSALFITGMIICYALSFAFMWYAVKKLDISVAYAIWAGLGTALITAGGIAVFKEEVTMLKLLFVSCIIVGVVGLHTISNQ